MQANGTILPTGPPVNIPSLLPCVTVEIVSKIVPFTPVHVLEANLSLVLNALVEAQLIDRQMILMALATIRAEVGCFQPISERESPFNTSPDGHPFDLYDDRIDLGNLGPPDGANFRGRGFIQLTGRKNYELHGRSIGFGDQLLNDPDLANEPAIAAKLIASFLKANASRIQAALTANDLAEARRCVNGGCHGLTEFTAAYTTGLALIPVHIEVTPAQPLAA